MNVFVILCMQIIHSLLLCFYNEIPLTSAETFAHYLPIEFMSVTKIPTDATVFCKDSTLLVHSTDNVTLNARNDNGDVTGSLSVGMKASQNFYFIVLLFFLFISTSILYLVYALFY